MTPPKPIKASLGFKKLSPGDVFTLRQGCLGESVYGKRGLPQSAGSTEGVTPFFAPAALATGLKFLHFAAVTWPAEPLYCQGTEPGCR